MWGEEEEEEEEMRHRHRCKLCHRRFSNGRALGGHMKAHLATPPLPLPPRNTAEEEEEQVVETEKGYSNNNTSYGYGLRENPKKSFRFVDPDFSTGCASVILIQDTESDTDSKTARNTTTTRPRSKRSRRTSLTKPTSPTVTSSVEEDVAISLMMLSRDVWITNKTSASVIVNKKKKVITSSSRTKNHRCAQCNKVFRSYQAMCGHSKICCYNNRITLTRNLGDEDDEKMFECPYCEKVFGSGQALGGHKRSHQLNNANNSRLVKQQHHHLGFIDLNLPAPLDDQDDFSSVLSDA